MDDGEKVYDVKWRRLKSWLHCWSALGTMLSGRLPDGTFPEYKEEWRDLPPIQKSMHITMVGRTPMIRWY